MRPRSPLSARFLALLAALIALAPAAAWARLEPTTPTAPTPPPAATPALHDPAPVPPQAVPIPGVRFDPVAATEAYIATIPAEKRAKTDAYFEGGYWLRLWDFAVPAAAALLILASGLSARMQRFAERLTRWRWLQPLLFGLPYFLLTELLTFPLTIYEGYYREHQFGLSNQTLGAWLKEHATGMAVGAIAGACGILVLYAILRRVQRAWWIWASVASVGLTFVLASLAPVFIAPLFNTYTPLETPALRDPILSLARANEIPADNVYVYNLSKQSDRISANVSGALGTMRISLGDTLINRCSPAAVRAVMAHEMGHYVMNHIYKGQIMMGLVFVVAFGAAAWAFERIRARKGAAWGINSVADPAGFPLIIVLLSTCFFLFTPVINTIIRTQENEADAFGLNAAREPDGMAEASLLLGEYRKMKAGPVEEFIFYDHPTGYNRILRAMTWKAENLPATSH